MNEIASDMNKSKRQLMFNPAMADWVVEIVLQVTSYRAMFKPGCHLPTLGKTITSPADHTTAERRNGSFRETHSQHGRRLPIQVLFYGSMENVCSYLVFFSRRTETDSLFCSGCGKEHLMVR